MRPGKTVGFSARLIIENVSPQIDCGRYAAKRIVGDLCEVGADILKDGHDLLAARILVRRPSSRSWEILPLTYDYDSDRWYGSFRLDEIGRWSFTVEAWPDEFGTWLDDLSKWLKAGQDVSLNLREGALAVRKAMERADGVARSTLSRVVEALENEPDIERRTRIVQHPTLRKMSCWPKSNAARVGDYEATSSRSALPVVRRLINERT